jgi:hypothetical protein
MIIDNASALMDAPRRGRDAAAGARRRLGCLLARARQRLPQLNDVLAIYALGLAIVDLVVYWRAQTPH